MICCLWPWLFLVDLLLAFFSFCRHCPVSWTDEAYVLICCLWPRLFQVDLLFTEDTGFLQTVHQFMLTSKIPIILTASDSHFRHRLAGRFRHLIFSTPPLVCISTPAQHRGWCLLLVVCCCEYYDTGIRCIWLHHVMVCISYIA